PVLAASGLGIAMGGMGSAAAVEAADIVLMNDRPSDVATAVKIAKKTMRIIYEDIAFSLFVKIGVLILAAFGFANMWLAIFADVGVCMIAILNSMRALRVN
ncbi:MAG: heavy metal translocating P-type ATPase, partial [Firmicutes bacterium]|nr:heavy metal translocating P-type ATPase [Bacillota bacterium]